jgi:phage shock protein PspC (stress-responsive transcriptional regulator)
MNKVVNINLSGLVFSIDETAYEQLKSYLDGLKRHFEGTDGAAEIISDIEARIAELLQAKLTDRQTVVQPEDVKEVIALMGDPRQIDGEEEEQPRKEHRYYEPHGPKKLRRDPNHKTLGGVCAGLANYFGVDIIIPRVLFLIALFGFGSGLLLYIILWAVIPEATITESNQDGTAKVKRLFRNPDDKTIGGVCSGVAEYIGIDAVWLRIAFLVAFFVFGTGFLIYIILWIAIPMAKTSAEKLQMKGEPVDVSNIEKTVRDTIGKSGDQFKKSAHTASQNVHRASSALSEILNSLFKLIGKAIGAFLLILSIVVIGVLIFLWNYSFGDVLQKLDVADIYAYFQYGFALFSFSVAALILLTGIKLLFHARLKLKLVTLLLITTMIIGVGLMLSFGLQYKQSVSEKETIKENVITTVCPDTLYIRAAVQPGGEDMKEISIRVNEKHGKKVYKVGYLGNLVKVFYNTRLNIKPSKTDSLQLTLVRSARGESDQAAAENARSIGFNATLEGNVLTIDRGIILDSSRSFKFQQVFARLRVPVGTIIKVDKHIMKMLNEQYEEDFDMGETFKMNSQGMRCLDCVDSEDNYEDDDMNIEWDMDDENGDINIHIGKDDEGKEGITIQTTPSDSTEKSKTVRVKKYGPITVEKEVEVK